MITSIHTTASSTKFPFIGVASLLVLATSYAATGALTKEFGITLHPFSWLLAQVVLGSTGLFPLVGMRRIGYRDWLILFVRAALGWCAGGYLFFQAIKYGEVGLAAALSALPWGVVWGVLLYSERLSFISVCGIILTTLGVLMVGDSVFSINYSTIAALLSGALITLAQSLRRLQSREIPDIVLACYGNAAAALLLTGIALVSLTPATLSHELTSLSLTAIVLLMLQQSMNAYLINFAFARVANSLASILLTLEIVAGIAIGVAFFGEPLPPSRIIAIGLISIGAIIVASGSSHIRIPSRSMMLLYKNVKAVL